MILTLQQMAESALKTPEDEAFDDLARRQGGGFPAKRQMAEDKQKPWPEDEWRRNNWRCGHGWLRGEQCEICNAAQEPDMQTGIAYQKGFHDGKQAALAQPPQCPWVGLMDEEIDKWTPEIQVVIRAVEQLLKEKNT